MWWKIQERVRKQPLYEVLRKQRLITADQAACLSTAEGTGRLPIEIAQEQASLSEEQIITVLTEACRIPFIDLTHYELDEESAALIPERVARQYKVVPLEIIGSVLLLGMADPTHREAIDEIEQITRCSIRPFVCRTAAIEQGILSIYSPKKSPEQDDEEDRKEKRRFPRIFVDIPLTITGSGGRKFESRSVDLSASGISFESHRSFRRSSVMEVTLGSLKGTVPPIKCHGSVVRVSIVADNLKRTSLRFENIEVDDRQRLQAAIDQLAGAIN